MGDTVPPGVRLGIVRSISYGLFGKPDEFVPQLRRLGATLVRVYFFWSQVEPEPGQFSFDAVDAFLEQLDGSEEVWVTVCSSSRWATEQATDFLPPSRARDPDDYLAQLKVFSRAVKDADPAAAVLLGGATHALPAAAPDSPERRFFDQLLRDGGDEGAELTVRHPSAETFTLLADQLAGTERVTRAEVPGRPSLHLFEVDRRDRGPLLVVWDQRDSFTGEDQPPVPLDRPWPAAAAAAVDAFGHAQPAEVGDGRLRLAVSVDPLFVTAA